MWPGKQAGQKMFYACISMAINESVSFLIN